MAGSSRSWLGATIALVVGLGVGTMALAETPAETIKKRQALMKELGGHMGAIYDFTQGKGSETAADVAKRAEGIKALAPQIAGLFPPGTSRYVAPSAALPAIWTDWAGFEAAASNLAVEAGKLVEVANGGDKAAIEAQFGATGKNGCGGCHSKFREKKN